MALQQKVETLLSDSLDGYGLVKGLLADYSRLRSRASFELEARQRLVENGFIPELSKYIGAIRAVASLGSLTPEQEQQTAIKIDDLLLDYEQQGAVMLQNFRDAAVPAVEELKDAGADLYSAMQDNDYHKGAYAVSRITRHAKWQPIKLVDIIKSLEAMHGLSADLHAVDKKRVGLTAAYFTRLISYGEHVLEEAQKQRQEPYNGDISPEIIAKALFGRHNAVDLSLYKEPLWRRISERAKTLFARQQTQQPQPTLESTPAAIPEGPFRAEWYQFMPPLFHVNHTFLREELVSAPQSNDEEENRGNVMRTALSRADELGADVAVPHLKVLWDTPKVVVKFYKTEQLQFLRI